MRFELDNIELKYYKKVILRGIYLKAEVGKITGILGSNGCGKSSLLKIFFGTLQPKTKLLRIDGEAYLKPFFASGLVSYLPQHSLIPTNLKIKEAFDFYRVNWDEFIEYFPGFDLYSESKAHQLSGGERRLTEIYLCLKKPVKLVLLDEPFSHIAPVYLDKLKPLIKSEKEQKAIVMTDHMYRHILDLADDMYLMKNGCSRMITNPKELEDYKYVNAGTL